MNNEILLDIKILLQELIKAVKKLDPELQMESYSINEEKDTELITLLPEED